LENLDASLISSNWQKLKKTLPKSEKKPSQFQKPTAVRKSRDPLILPKPTAIPPIEIIHEAKNNDSGVITKCLALDCEMVSGELGDMLARVLIFNYHGNVIYDRFVQPVVPVTNYKTKYSLVTKSDLSHENAFPLKEVQEEVTKIIHKKIIVGYSLEHSFKALLLSHPFELRRDVAKYKPFREENGQSSSLKFLCRKFLRMNFEKEEQRDPVEDGRRTLLLYKKVENVWEEKIKAALAKKPHKKKKKPKKPQQTRTTFEKEEEEEEDIEFSSLSD